MGSVISLAATTDTRLTREQHQLTATKNFLPKHRSRILVLAPYYYQQNATLTLAFSTVYLSGRPPLIHAVYIQVA